MKVAVLLTGVAIVVLAYLLASGVIDADRAVEAERQAHWERLR